MNFAKLSNSSQFGVNTGIPPSSNVYAREHANDGPLLLPPLALLEDARGSLDSANRSTSVRRRGGARVVTAAGVAAVAVAATSCMGCGSGGAARAAVAAAPAFLLRRDMRPEGRRVRFRVAALSCVELYVLRCCLLLLLLCLLLLLLCVLQIRCNGWLLRCFTQHHKGKRKQAENYRNR
jgi:hypothetical protein